MIESFHFLSDRKKSTLECVELSSGCEINGIIQFWLFLAPLHAKHIIRLHIAAMECNDATTHLKMSIDFILM